MTRQENMFLAKKLFAELVFNTAYVEGVNVTFPQTQTIIDGGIVNNVPVGDIQTVLNLRDGWRYVLDTIDEPLTLDYVCKVNEYVSRNESLQWGKLRAGTVSKSGTDYLPPVPVAVDVEERISQISKISDVAERAIKFFCYAVRAQLFWDGNKRTSTIIASKILIGAGAGVLTIDIKHAQAFNEALTAFYDTADKAPLTEVLKSCIKVMEPVLDATNAKPKPGKPDKDVR